MKINEIIREKRKALSLTQEQIADFLGVSTPAVSKWEKGAAYPDITLLPALARLLKTDLNTLLFFPGGSDRDRGLKILSMTSIRRFRSRAMRLLFRRQWTKYGNILLAID